MHHTHTLINSTTQKQKKYCIYKKRILKSKRKKGQKKKLGKIIAMLSSITFLSFFCNYFLYRKTLISKNKMDMIRTVNQKGNTNDSNMKTYSTSMYNSRNAIQDLIRYFFKRVGLAKIIKLEIRGFFKDEGCEINKWILYFQQVLWILDFFEKCRCLWSKLGFKNRVCISFPLFFYIVEISLYTLVFCFLPWY